MSLLKKKNFFNYICLFFSFVPPQLMIRFLNASFFSSFLPMPSEREDPTLDTIFHQTLNLLSRSLFHDVMHSPEAKADIDCLEKMKKKKNLIFHPSVSRIPPISTSWSGGGERRQFVSSCLFFDLFIHGGSGHRWQIARPECGENLPTFFPRLAFSSITCDGYPAIQSLPPAFPWLSLFYFSLSFLSSSWGFGDLILHAIKASPFF